MLNMLESRVFKYDENRREVTVYQDDEDLNKWYIVPEPRFAQTIVSGQSVAEFTLVQYKTQQGAAGTCTFTAELIVSPEALAAVYQNLGDEIALGQLDWQMAEAYFYYQVSGEEKVLNVTPSLAGTNRSAFVITLETQEEVNTFKNAFGPDGGSVSPFRIDFDVTALARLQAVTAKVTYNSQLAFEYEKEVDVDKNVWGKVTSRRETIKQELRQSDAGDVELTWGLENPSGELQQRVNDWAWVTLESLVNKAVDDALRTVGEQNADQFSLSATASFERTYTENQVIAWAFTPTQFLPKFNAQQWPLHYSEVDNRRLIVSFNILDDLEANGIDSVQVDVMYDGATHSHLFEPGEASSWILDVDGAVSGGTFDPNYEYRYIVKFTDEPTKTFTSDPIPSSATEVVLPVAALGTQKATFIGSNIDFKEVDFVLIDFYFATPGDQPNTAQQKRMTDNTSQIVFESRTFLPSANEYNYALTYVMKNGVRYRVDPISAFPPDNRAAVTVSSPFQNRTLYVAVLNPTDSEKIVQVQLEGTYDDGTNDINDANAWNFAPNPTLGYEQAQQWILSVVGNPNGSSVRYNGFLITSDGQQRRVSNLFVQQNPFLNLSATDEVFSVVIDPSQVQWQENQIQQIKVDMYRIEGDPADDLVAASVDRTQLETFTFRPATDEDGNVSSDEVPEQYYNFNYPVDGQGVYFYRATYYYADGTTKDVAQTEGDSQRVVLPSNADAGEATVLRVEVAARAVA